MENINKYKKAITILKNASSISGTSDSKVIKSIITLDNLINYFDHAQHLVKAYQQAIAAFMSTDPDAAYKLQGLVFDEQQKLEDNRKNTTK